MTPSPLALIRELDHGALLYGTDDGWTMRLNQPEAPGKLPLCTLIGSGFSETWQAASMSLGLARAREIIARRRKMVAAGLCPDECALAEASRRIAA